MYFIVFLCVVFTIIIAQTRSSALKHAAKITRTDSLLRSSAQWLQASKNIYDPILSLIHVSKSSAFLSAARTQMGDEDIENFYPSLQTLIKNVEKQEKNSFYEARKKVGFRF